MTKNDLRVVTEMLDGVCIQRYSVLSYSFYIGIDIGEVKIDIM